MGTTLDGARLKSVSVSGAKVSADLAQLCVGASLSVAIDKVTEMGFTFQDTHDLDLFNSKLFVPGASVRYGDWFLTCDGLKLQSGKAGPVVTINAPSKFVTTLRGKSHQGAKSWGSTSVTSWVAGIAKSVGMSHLVQPGLGVKSIARVAPEDGGQAESTWDVLAQQARESGCWLFEYGSTLVFAKPSYLVRATWPRRTWSLVWHNWLDHSEGMVGMPQYEDNPGAELRESMTVKLISKDADQARPGDAVVLTGRAVGAMGGTWIINAVDFPLHVAGAVTVTCQRPIDPKVEPPRTETSSGGSKASTSGRAAASSGGGSVPVASGVGSAVDRWAAGVNGRAIDMDGSFGAQCVDLANHYHINVAGGGGQVFANGNQWFGNAPASIYEKYPVGSAWGEKAGKGDIACWSGFYGGGYGHVAIVLEDRGGSLLVMSQNPGPARAMVLSKQGLQGYLRPKRVR